MGDEFVLYFQCHAYDRHSWYRIDLQCLPEKLSRFAVIKWSECSAVNFTVVDEVLYCNGGVIGSRGFGVEYSRDLFKYNLRNPKPVREIEHSERKIRRINPFVCSVGRKIYTLGGLAVNGNVDADFSRFWGEVYDLDSRTLKPVGRIDSLFDDSFIGTWGGMLGALMGKTVVFYGHLLHRLMFFDTKKGEFRYEWHEELGDLPLENPTLMTSVSNRRPVIWDSTIWWFCTDGRLYGYDFKQKMWLSSASVEEKLWPLSPRLSPPCLVKLYGGKFILLVCLNSTTDKIHFLGIATLAVTKDVGTLNVSLEKCDKIPVDRAISVRYGEAKRSRTRKNA